VSGHFLAERELCTRAVWQRRVDLWKPFTDPFPPRALSEFDDEVVEFVLAVVNIRDDLFVLGW